MTVTEIRKGAFARSTNLTSVYLGDNTVNIWTGAFEKCLNLTNIGFGDKLVTIGDLAFSNLKKLRVLNFPKSLESFSGSAFNDYYNIEEINVDKDSIYFTSVEGILFDKQQETILKYPTNKQLNNYIIPNNIVTIGNGAFIKTDKVTNVFIPKTVINLSRNSFQNCSKTSVYFEVETKPDSYNDMWSLGEMGSVTWGYDFSQIQ